MNKRSIVEFDQVVGLDIGDRFCHIVVLERDSGEIAESSRVRTTSSALRSRFSGVTPNRIALEVGSHSPWISRLLSELGHEVIVANARKLRLIYQNRNKDDQIDAYLGLVPARRESGQSRPQLGIRKEGNTMLHHLWATAAVYDPDFQQHRHAA